MKDCLDGVKIFTESEVGIEEALEQMTDEWIERGEYCDYTILSLRDALSKYSLVCENFRRWNREAGERELDLWTSLGSAKRDANFWMGITFVSWILIGILLVK